MTETRYAEGGLWVTSGSRHCPHPDRCDQRRGEGYEAYVRRHALDHNLGEFDRIEDAERNLGVWCLFYLDKHVLGNLSIGTKVSDGDHQIVADWEPCWEDAEFLSNDDFDPDDLEQNTPWEERAFRLQPLAQRKPGISKRMKKLTKVRGTQKTSRARALVTFEHLHEYYIKGNIYFRALTISAASRLARDHYFKPIKLMWRTNRAIKRLYGAWEAKCSCYPTAVYSHEKGKCPKCLQPLPRGQVWRRVGLLARGGFGVDTMTMRWNVSAEDSSGQSIVSFMCAGIDTALTGSRWDLVLFDDPHNRKNVNTLEQRHKVKLTHAELRKQIDARGRMVWLNTPWHLQDASQQIDDEFGDEFHILYRPAFWTSPVTKQECYYWQRDAMGRVVWDRDRINTERRQVDFYSQVALRPRNPDDAMCSLEDFVVVDPERAPLEVRAALGTELTEDDAQELRHMSRTIRGIVYVDPAGLEQRKVHGADTAVIGIRFDAQFRPWVVFISSGRYEATVENEVIFQAWIRTRADGIRVELSGAHSKHVKQSLYDFQARKSIELQRPVVMPFIWEPVSTTRSKDERVEAVMPLIKRGVHILSDAGSPAEIQKFIEQLVYYIPGPGLKDLADAFSMVMADVEIPTWEEAMAEAAPAEKVEFEPNDDPATGGQFSIPVALLIAKLDNEEKRPRVMPWGLAGGVASNKLDKLMPGESL